MQLKRLIGTCAGYINVHCTTLYLQNRLQELFRNIYVFQLEKFKYFSFPLIITDSFFYILALNVYEKFPKISSKVGRWRADLKSTSVNIKFTRAAGKDPVVEICTAVELVHLFSTIFLIFT